MDTDYESRKLIKKSLTFKSIAAALYARRHQFSVPVFLCCFTGNCKWLTEYASFRKSAFVVYSSILGCCAVSIDIYRISKVLRSPETSVILSAHTALSPINQHSSRINFVHLHLHLRSQSIQKRRSNFI